MVIFALNYFNIEYTTIQHLTLGMDSIIVNDSLLHYCGLLAYIITGISSAYIKWSHVCLPYRGQENIYYPNRKKWILTYALSILLIGCLLFPHNNDNWVASKCFMILICPNFMINGIRKQCNNTHKISKGFIAAEIPLITLAVLLCIFGWMGTGLLTQYSSYIIAAVGIIGFAYTIGIIESLLWLKKQTQIYYENKYSNFEEFPTKFAKKVTILFIILIPIIWANFISINHTMAGITFFLIAAEQIYFLNYMLDTHIKVKKDGQCDDCDSSDTIFEDEFDDCNAEPNEALHAYMKDFMEKEKPFLNAHLTIMELAKALNTNVPTLRCTCKTNYGSFIKMVNGYRLDYAKKLREQHPEYSKQAIAEDSGFGSYRSLLRAEKSDN